VYGSPSRQRNSKWICAREGAADITLSVSKPCLRLIEATARITKVLPKYVTVDGQLVKPLAVFYFAGRHSIGTDSCRTIFSPGSLKRVHDLGRGGNDSGVERCVMVLWGSRISAHNLRH